ncbi:MAG: 1-deoxy-D-xylulose-5-phosphate reductoisomerase [Lachnospiraceae bacterium]|nr:1-deoxy-D-xylulose-5-phosphate reductoisomerase [Lachnospiraceae bacterium]
MKRISLLGSTGSIGRQALSVISAQDDLEVAALAASTNIKLLEEQARRFSPKLVCVYDEDAARTLAVRLGDTDIKVVSGMDGLIECAAMDGADMVLTAVVGMIGIRPTIEAIKAGHDIALANKETLVCAGHIIMKLAAEKGVPIYPVDSEHSAIFQSLEARGADGTGQSADKIEKILLTASGGPFRGKKRDELKNVGPEDALKHPNWNMGRKITIDSATMVNKALEVMEACHLFGVTSDRIEVIVQPQSIIHSAVQFTDGSIIAQLGCPDMRLPIQYALTYPERRPLSVGRLDLAQLGSISFEKPDLETFDGLALGIEVSKKGGNLPTVFNAANEYAVAKFLLGQIRFLDIAQFIRNAVEGASFTDDPSLEEILETERLTYARLDEMRGKDR